MRNMVSLVVVSVTAARVPGFDILVLQKST